MAAKPGRKPNLVRRQLAARLYAAGLSQRQVARRLGCTHQAVQQLLRAAGVACPQVCRVACAGCGAEVAPSYPLPRPPEAYCAACLEQRPGLPFGVRLRSCRLTAGLTQKRLARRAGLLLLSVNRYEAGKDTPTWPGLARLLAVLGGALVPGCEGVPAARPPAGFGRRLRSRRRAAGLSATEAASRCGVTPLMVYRYERGESLPGWGALCRLVRAFGPALLAPE
jgi:transcriptional regulator with XRE-family HTH domain